MKSPTRDKNQTIINSVDDKCWLLHKLDSFNYFVEINEQTALMRSNKCYSNFKIVHTRVNWSQWNENLSENSILCPQCQRAALMVNRLKLLLLRQNLIKIPKTFLGFFSLLHHHQALDLCLCQFSCATYTEEFQFLL